MAEAASSQDLRCSKCRSGLGVNPDQVHDLEGQTLDQTLIFLKEDKLPEWIEQKVEECSWTKTKLHCPNCGVRVGGVDFVGGADHPVHLIKSKVDCALSAVAKEELRKLLNPSRPEHQQQPEQQQPSSSSTVDEQPSTSSSSSAEQSSSVSPAPVLEMLLISNSINYQDISDVSTTTDESDESDISSQSSQTSSGSSSAELATSVSSSTSSTPSSASERSILLPDNDEDGEEELSAEAATAILSKKQKNKLRLKRRRYEKLTLQRKLSKTLQEAKQIAEERLIRNILEAEPELDELDHAVICPVCLDLLYEPYKVDPCKHIFCEPCLRRLGSKNPMNTSCPMCRQRIVYCEPQREFSRAIREAHHSMHMKRKKFERGTNVFTLPLPWRPGWRNLISGRAMGGNRMANETNAEAFRQFLQQLPYYIPPVVIANLINLLFFICLLGAVEIFPLLFSLVMGRGPMGMSALSRAAVSPVVEPPIVSNSNEQHDVETSAPVEDISVGSDIMRDVLRDVLSDIDDDDSSAMIGEIPLPASGVASHPFEMPEAVGPAMDATFYYVLCTMSLIAAAFGNFLIVQQQPLFALIPQGTLFDRLYNHPAFGRHFQRFSDLFLIVGLSCVPILLLPLVLPTPSELPVPASSVDNSVTSDPLVESSDSMLKYKLWMSSSFRSFIQVLILLIESVNSVMTFQNIVSLAVVYYVTCTFFNYRGIGAN